MMERDGIRWTIRATGGADKVRNDLVTGLALLLSDREPGATPEAIDDEGHHVGGLWNLLPDESDFPFPIRVTEETAGNDTRD
jgi:hypothetical protein